MYVYFNIFMWTNQVSIILKQLHGPHIHNTIDYGIWLSEKMEALEMPLSKIFIWWNWSDTFVYFTRHLCLLHTLFCYNWVLIVRAIFRHVLVSLFINFFGTVFCWWTKSLLFLLFCFAYHWILFCLILAMLLWHTNTKIEVGIM